MSRCQAAEGRRTGPTQRSQVDVTSPSCWGHPVLCDRPDADQFVRVMVTISRGHSSRCAYAYAGPPSSCCWASDTERGIGTACRCSSLLESWLACRRVLWTCTPRRTTKLGPLTPVVLVALIVAMVAVVAFIVFVERSDGRIPCSMPSASWTQDDGRPIPPTLHLRVNSGGVMPVLLPVRSSPRPTASKE